MQTPIASTALRQDLTRIIDDVQYAGTQYVIMRYERPAAALVPIALYDRWKREREDISEALRDLRQNHPGSEADRAMAEVLLALQTLTDSPAKHED